MASFEVADIFRNQGPAFRASRAAVTFSVKDYRQDGAACHRTLTLEASEFIRRFLLHVPPRGFHRIRYYGFLTGPDRQKKLDRIRVLLGMPLAHGPATTAPDKDEPPPYARPVRAAAAP